MRRRKLDGVITPPGVVPKWSPEHAAAFRDAWRERYPESDASIFDELPAGEEQRIRERVQWMYRHTIKSPTDSLEELAREYGVTTLDVEVGIAEAERLLELLTPLDDDDETGSRLGR